eukprot:6028310-Prymnesium_polylepis.1
MRPQLEESNQEVERDAMRNALFDAAAESRAVFNAAFDTAAQRFASVAPTPRSYASEKAVLTVHLCPSSHRVSTLAGRIEFSHTNVPPLIRPPPPHRSTSSRSASKRMAL